MSDKQSHSRKMLGKAHLQVASAAEMVARLQRSAQDKQSADADVAELVARLLQANDPHDKPGYNERMKEMLTEDNRRVAWTKRKWAEELGCSHTTVGNQPMWKKIMEMREENKRRIPGR